jgi:hypothetical protein
MPDQNNHPRSIPIHERPGLLLARIRWFVPEAGASGYRAHFFGTELLRGACICLGEFVHIVFGLVFGLGTEGRMYASCLFHTEISREVSKKVPLPPCFLS